MEYFLKDDFIITNIITKEIFPGVKTETKGSIQTKDGV